MMSKSLFIALIWKAFKLNLVFFLLFNMMDNTRNQKIMLISRSMKLNIPQKIGFESNNSIDFMYFEVFLV